MNRTEPLGHLAFREHAIGKIGSEFHSISPEHRPPLASLLNQFSESRRQTLGVHLLASLRLMLGEGLGQGKAQRTPRHPSSEQGLSRLISTDAIDRRRFPAREAVGEGCLF